MTIDKESPLILVYALVFFLMLALVSYLLLKQSLEARQVSTDQTQLISPSVNIDNIFK